MKALLQNHWFREFLIFAGLLSGALLLSTAFAHPSFATSLIESSDQIGAVKSLTGGEGDLKTLVATILNFFLGFLGFVMVVMIIYAGVLYVTSAGNEENVGKAKKILLYCVIGVILIAISYAFVNTLLGAAAGGTTTSTGVSTGTAQ
jgi:hypothetical protein